MVAVTHPSLPFETWRSLLIHLFDNSLISCLFSSVRAPTHPAPGRQLCLEGPELFFWGKSGKKIHPTMDSNGPKNRGGRGECTGVCLPPPSTGPVCLAWAAHPPPPEFPNKPGRLSAWGAGTARRGKEKGLGRQGAPADGELSHGRGLRAGASSLAAHWSLLGS